MTEDIVRQTTENGTIVEIDFSELTKWVRGTNSRQGKIVRELDHLGVDIENKLGDKAETISATGQLHESKYSNVEISMSLESYKVEAGLKAPHAKQAMDDGTAPEDAPTSKELERWVGLRFGLSGQEKKRVAYLVARKLARVGSRKFREGGPKLFEEAYQELTSQGIIQKSMQKIGEIYIE